MRFRASARPARCSPSASIASIASATIGVPARLRLTWYDPPEDLTAGRDYALVVRLRPPRGLANRSAFDYERWLMLEGYGASGYVRSGGAVERSRSLAQRWLIRRHELADRIAAASPSPGAAALLTALAIGEREGFDDSHWEWLRRTGTSHLVAISGMHIGLVAAFAFALVRLLWLRMPYTLANRDLEAAWPRRAPSRRFVYAALAGFGLPTQRAVLMVAVALAMLVSRRTVGLFNGLAAALIAILVWDPLATLTASFWLSFSAVAALLALGSRRELTLPGQGAGCTVCGRSSSCFRECSGTSRWPSCRCRASSSARFRSSRRSSTSSRSRFSVWSWCRSRSRVRRRSAFGEVGALLVNLTGWLADGAWIGARPHRARWPWAAVTLPEPSPFGAVLAVHRRPHGARLASAAGPQVRLARPGAARVRCVQSACAR